MRRHRLDPLSLVFGLLLTGLGLLFLVGRLDVAVHARWLWPIVLLGLGVAILLGARPRRAALDRASEEAVPVDQAAGADRTGDAAEQASAER